MAARAGEEKGGGAAAEPAPTPVVLSLREEQQLPAHVAPVQEGGPPELASENRGGSNKSGCVCCCALARSCVSLKKRRFVDDGYDIDLAYITDRILAFGYPTTGAEACWRNPAETQVDFLDSRHPDKYRVYNLCAEANRQYHSSLFHDRLACYQWYDHQPPPFDMIIQACGDVAAWLAADPANVAGLHCKAGKGRTGTLICCILMHLGLVASPQAALQLFGTRRTLNGKGVTLPSQRRFVMYYALQLAAIRRFGTAGVDAEAVEAGEAQPSADSAEVDTSDVGEEKAPAPPSDTDEEAGDGEEVAEAGEPVGGSGPEEEVAVVPEPVQRVGPWSAGSITTVLPQMAAFLQGVVVQGTCLSYSHLSMVLFRQEADLTLTPLASLPPASPGAWHAPAEGAVAPTEFTSLASPAPLLVYGSSSSVDASFAGVMAGEPDLSLTLHEPVPRAPVARLPRGAVWQGTGLTDAAGGEVPLPTGDYRIVLSGHSGEGGAGHKLGWMWFNSAFLPCVANPDTPAPAGTPEGSAVLGEQAGTASAPGGLRAPGVWTVPKREVEGLFKDTKHATVSSDFAVSLLYTVQR